MRVKPSLVVNDNVYIKSEWWLGSPVYGFYGSSLPYSQDQRWINSTFSRGSPITAQRFWGEFVGDFGTIQVGRIPLHWGLGLVWNSGDQMWDRYQSTGDAFRLVSKFGSFTVTPGIIKYATGNSVSGNCVVGAVVDPATGTKCAANAGAPSVVDYAMGLEYQSLEDETSVGVNFVRRVGGAAADPAVGLGFDNGVPGSSYNLWDFYGKKRFGKVTAGIEVPLVNGKIGGTAYNALAGAAEVSWKVNDRFELNLRGGRAPGQKSKATGSAPSEYGAFYFHQNYRTGLILFNYALQNFVGPNTLNNPSTSANDLVSPYDNPITNANFVNFGLNYKLNRWSFRGNYVFASAVQTASTGDYYNTWKRGYETVQAGAPAQGSSLGWEMDYGLTYRWDDNIAFDVDAGWYFPGAFYAFSNQASGVLNPTKSVFMALFRVGVGF